MWMVSWRNLLLSDFQSLWRTSVLLFSSKLLSVHSWSDTPTHFHSSWEHFQLELSCLRFRSLDLKWTCFYLSLSTPLTCIYAALNVTLHCEMWLTGNTEHICFGNWGWLRFLEDVSLTKFINLFFISVRTVLSSFIQLSFMEIWSCLYCKMIWLVV